MPIPDVWEPQLLDFARGPLLAVLTWSIPEELDYVASVLARLRLGTIVVVEEPFDNGWVKTTRSLVWVMTLRACAVADLAWPGEGRPMGMSRRMVTDAELEGAQILQAPIPD